METIYYIHDAADGKLVILRIECDDDEDIEDAVTHEADERGMGMSNVSWGGVSSINFDI